MGRFDGKVAIITGSSTGIGKAVALLFAKEGAKVVLTARSSANLQKAREELLQNGISADHIHVIAGDITVNDFQKQLIQSTVDKWGKINILVNNAGAGIKDPSGAKGITTPTEIFNKNMQLNFTSVLELTNLATPYLATTRGEVVNISTALSAPNGISLFPDLPFYSISKTALDQLTRAQALELIQKGIRVNSVNPGLTVTEFFATSDLASKEQAQAIFDKFASTRTCQPIGRVGTGCDMAEAVAFLADRNRSEFILGQCLVVDGGLSLVVGAAAAL